MAVRTSVKANLPLPDSKLPGSRHAPSRVSAVILSLILAGLTSLGANAQVRREDDSNLQKELSVPLYVWRDPKRQCPSAILVAVHGSAQEGAVMDGLARLLVAQGYAVISPDVRGDGRWQRVKEPPQMADVQLMQTSEDVRRILGILNHDYPDTDIFCLGESIGAGVVLRAVSTNPQNVRGVILVSAGVRPHLHNPLNMSSDFLKGMASIFQPVDLTEYISRYCSEDPRVVNEMLHDPLGKNRQSALDLFGTFQFLKQEPQFASMMPPVIPVLAIQGTVDQVVEPDSINDLMNALPTKQKQLLMVPNCGHVIVGTSFLKPMVVTAITSFLQEHKTRGSVAPSAEPAALGHSVGEHSLVNPSDFSGGNSGNGRSNRDTPATN